MTFLIIYDIILSLNYAIKKECKEMNLINQPEQVSQYCLVSSLALREAKNGSKYVELTLSDKTASVPGCKLWNVTKEIWEVLQKNEVIFVNGVN